MPQSATPLSRAMPSGVFTLAEQPSVTVIIDDHRRFHELQEPPPGRNRTPRAPYTCGPELRLGARLRRFHEVSEVSTKPRAPGKWGAGILRPHRAVTPPVNQRGRIWARARCSLSRRLARN
jgi:hypothetical protein